MPSRHPHMRFPFSAALACCALAATSGCVRHHATVTPPAAAGVADDGQRPPSFLATGGATIERDRSTPIVASGPLPIDLAVTAWRRSTAGPLERADLRVQTALPWWQRFPADLVADLLPIDAEVGTEATVTLVTVPRADLEAFVAHAERDGYAHRQGAAK
jgi:hypothetical protein